MIKILSIFAIAILCYVGAKMLAIQYSPQSEHFFWGWMASVATGFLINAYAWFIKND